MLAIILAAGLLASAAAQASSESLRLKVSAPATLMVGEPTKLQVVWTALRDVEVVTAKGEVWLDRGPGFRRYHETSFGTASTVYWPERLVRGATLVREHVLAVSGYAGGPEDRHFELAFPRPGHYRARVQYEGVVSNEVAIEVTMPKEKDAEVLAHLQRRPELLSEWGLIADFGSQLLEKLLDEYPGSRHLGRPRVLSWRKELDEARAADQQSGTPPAEGRTAQLLARLEGADLEDTPFEEDRLLLIGDTAVSIGDRVKARAAYDRLAAQSPSTEAAEKARRWLAVEGGRASRDRME